MSIFQDGYNAFYDAEENPYPIETKEYQEWESGYNFAFVEHIELHRKYGNNI